MNPKISFEELKAYMRPIVGAHNKAKKDKYLIEPRKNSFYEWEDFNTSNPTLMQLDDYNFLGYRAGGHDTSYVISPNGDLSWGSELGLAILDKTGKNVEVRFPLPIFKSQRKIMLPKTIEEYNYILKNLPDEDIAYHDFRLINLDDNVYIYYHNGKIASFYDCIVKMSKEKFLSKINDSINMIKNNAVNIKDWFILWSDSDWTNAGYNGERRFYSSVVPKNNISIYKLKDGSIHCTHRPAPDNAIIKLGDKTSISCTDDGITKMGALETCVRADCFDNSHLGSNGTETLATIKGEQVLIDVTHGVHNLAFGRCEKPGWEMCYMPFFRVKDYETGEVLFWSRQPIMTIDDEWSDYCYYGNWVNSLQDFCYTSFPGGQLPEIKGKNSENDSFYCAIGLGDTATGRLSFKISDIIDESVMARISSYHYFKDKKQQLNVAENEYRFENEISGWKFSIKNINNQMTIVSSLKNNVIDETNYRPVHKDAQSFDFSMAIFDGKSIFYDETIGYVALFQGVTFEKENGKDVSKIGYGIMIMHKDNPNRIRFKSFESIVPVVTEQGITFDKNFKEFSKEELLKAIPENAMRIIKKMVAFEPFGCCYASTHTQWLKNKANGKVNF